MLLELWDLPFRVWGGASGRNSPDDVVACIHHLSCKPRRIPFRGSAECLCRIIRAYHPMVAPVLLYERFESYGLNYSRPIATLMILTCLTVFVALRVTAGRTRRSRS